MPNSQALVLATVLTMTVGCGISRAADPTALAVTLHDHRFEPAELRAPAGVPIVLTVNNQDTAAEEFESKALKLEKVVAGKRTIVLRIPAQPAGRYGFVGEYHEDTAQGVLVVEERK